MTDARNTRTANVEALVVTPEGVVEHASLETDDGSTLQALYRAIGCDSVAVVGLSGGIDMWLDDEGVFRQEANPAATWVAICCGHGTQLYFGPAVFTSVDRDGNTVSLSAAQRSRLLEMLS